MIKEYENGYQVTEYIKSKLYKAIEKLEKYNHNNVKIKVSIDVSNYLIYRDTISTVFTVECNGKTEKIKLFGEIYSSLGEKDYLNGIEEEKDKLLRVITGIAMVHYGIENSFDIKKDTIKNIFEFINYNEIINNNEAMMDEHFEELLIFRKKAEMNMAGIVGIVSRNDNRIDNALRKRIEYFAKLNDFIESEDMENLNMMYDMMYGE